jgi:hypothetical protein
MKKDNRQTETQPTQRRNRKTKRTKQQRYTDMIARFCGLLENCGYDSGYHHRSTVRKQSTHITANLVSVIESPRDLAIHMFV